MQPEYNNIQYTATITAYDSSGFLIGEVTQSDTTGTLTSGYVGTPVGVSSTTPIKTVVITMTVSGRSQPKFSLGSLYFDPLASKLLQPALIFTVMPIAGFFT